jgi:hypothetical protein
MLFIVKYHNRDISRFANFFIDQLLYEPNFHNNIDKIHTEFDRINNNEFSK